MMQQYQIFSQRQTDTRPYGMEFTILPFIESLEHMIQFLFWNQLAGIVHTQFKSPLFLIMSLRHHNSSSFRSIFSGIGKQIVHHFIQFIHIKISRIFFRQIKLYGQFLLFNQRSESRH